MTEAEMQKTIIEAAHIYGWLVAHFRPAMTKHGWRTPVSADGKGFPDLIMVKSGRMIVAELKVGKNKLTPEQIAWLKAFQESVPGIEVIMATEETLDDVLHRLGRRTPLPNYLPACGRCGWWPCKCALPEEER